MKKIRILIESGLLIFILLLLQNCYPTYQATEVKMNSLESGDYSELQAKLFRSDDKIILFPDGFVVENNVIIGRGIISSNDQLKSINNIEVPFDSVSAMITYEETTSGARYFGSFLFAITAPPLSFLGVYCLACPKCCFGSCPTVYTFDGNDYNLEAELFSECISRQLEDNDVDIVKHKIVNNSIKLKITNEALETHYINKFNLVVAEHPLNTKLYLTADNKLKIVSNELTLLNAVTNEGKDITNLVNNDDDKYYRSGVDKVAKLKNSPTFDWIDITVPVAKDSSTTMIIKYRNTLLSTTLLYDVVIGSQGIKGLEWIKKMNEDPIYASQFKSVYEAFSGIKIKVWENNSWKELGKFKDAGPLNWKYLATQIRANDNKNLKIRLEFIPDNFMIDYIAFDTTKTVKNDVSTKLFYPTEVVDGYGNNRLDVLDYIKEDDSNYLKTDPGDSYLFTYNIPKKQNVEQSVLIYSKGYYNEWIRGGWLKNSNHKYSFNLYDITGTLSYLADSWLENSTIIENEFFHSKFSLKEEK